MRAILLLSVSNFIEMFINAKKIGKFIDERCFAAVADIEIKWCYHISQSQHVLPDKVLLLVSTCKSPRTLLRFSQGFFLKNRFENRYSYMKLLKKNHCSCVVCSVAQFIKSQSFFAGNVG